MIQFFNCFEVPAGKEDEFFALWIEVNAYMVNKSGYVSHQLHQSIDPAARYRFLNHGVWASAEHWRNAHDTGFRAMLSRPEWASFVSHPALYDIVHTGESSST